MKCINCDKELSGRQIKYCSRKCKNKDYNQSYQSYLTQQKRARDRKLELIKLKGNKCEICGYAKNHAALEFLHIHPGEKLFQLDSRCLSNRRWELILEELKKCQLLCLNCRAELHNPDCSF